MDLTGLPPNFTELRTPITLPALQGTNIANTTSTPMPSVASVVDSVERLVKGTPTKTPTNSEGAEKRKLVASSDLMRAVHIGLTAEERADLDELENIVQVFKKQRIKLGFTQGDVAVALGRRYASDFSQTTISRFEAQNLSYKNMCRLRPLLKEWLYETEIDIANGATITDLLDRPIAENTPPMTALNVAAGDSNADGEPPAKRRRRRTNLDLAQRTTLDTYFAMNPRPDHAKMVEIANLLELDRDVIRVWFCNRRQKTRRADAPQTSEDPLISSLTAIAKGGDAAGEGEPQS